MAELAEMIRSELGADRDLIHTMRLPPKMTLIKRPTLDRQRDLLGFEPTIGIREGVRRVCAHQLVLLGQRPAEAPRAAGAAVMPGDQRMTHHPPLESVGSIRPTKRAAI
jgi:hypothetical protein